MWVGEGRLSTRSFFMTVAGIFIRWETSLVGSCGSMDSACVEGGEWLVLSVGWWTIMTITETAARWQ